MTPGGGSQNDEWDIDDIPPMELTDEEWAELAAQAELDQDEYERTLVRDALPC